MAALPINIRELGIRDAQALRRVNLLFGRVFGHADAYQEAPPSDAWLEQLLASSTFIALLAEEEGQRGCYPKIGERHVRNIIWTFT